MHHDASNDGNVVIKIFMTSPWRTNFPVPFKLWIGIGDKNCSRATVCTNFMAQVHYFSNRKGTEKRLCEAIFVKLM